MLKKFSLYLVIALAMMVVLVSCSRSASQAPVATGSAPAKTNTPAAGLGTPLSQVDIFSTQTALANQTLMATPAIIMPSPTPAVTLIAITLVPTTGPGETPTPATTPVVIVPVPTVGVPSTYTLQSGEQPYCIARRFNVNQYDLLTLNGLNNANASNLAVGYVLTIPHNGNTFVGPRTLVPHPATYTVSSSNETIYSIACHYGDVDPSQIIAANNLASPYTLHINQVLTIP